MKRVLLAATVLCAAACGLGSQTNQNQLKGSRQAVAAADCDRAREQLEQCLIAPTPDGCKSLMQTIEQCSPTTPATDPCEAVRAAVESCRASGADCIHEEEKLQACQQPQPQPTPPTCEPRPGTTCTPPTDPCEGVRRSVEACRTSGCDCAAEEEKLRFCESPPGPATNLCGPLFEALAICQASRGDCRDDEARLNECLSPGGGTVGDPCEALRDAVRICATAPTRPPNCDELEAKLLTCH